MTEARRDLAVGRRRQDDLDGEMDGLADAGELGAVTLLGVTATDGAYPVSARAVYKLDVTRAVCLEKEGAAVTFQGIGRHIYAANIGVGVPPLGTRVVARLVDGGRYVFEYD